MRRLALPRNARIVVVSGGARTGQGGPADELGWRLHRRGWWVDRPDGLDVLPTPLGRLRGLYAGAVRHVPGLLEPGGDSCAEGWAARGIAAALDRLTDRTAALIGDAPHAVVATHPLVSQLLGRLRTRGELDAPAITYLADPAVHPLWWHPGVDIVLRPHPWTAGQIARPARGSDTTVIETAPALPRSLGAAREKTATAGRLQPVGADPGWIIHRAAAGWAAGARPDDLFDTGVARPPSTGTSRP